MISHVDSQTRGGIEGAHFDLFNYSGIALHCIYLQNIFNVVISTMTILPCLDKVRY